jgi:hypothetical protein
VCANQILDGFIGQYESNFIIYRKIASVRHKKENYSTEAKCIMENGKSERVSFIHLQIQTPRSCWQQLILHNFEVLYDWNY